MKSTRIQVNRIEGQAARVWDTFGFFFVLGAVYLAVALLAVIAGVVLHVIPAGLDTVRAISVPLALIAGLYAIVAGMDGLLAQQRNAADEVRADGHEQSQARQSLLATIVAAARRLVANATTTAGALPPPPATAGGRSIAFFALIPRILAQRPITARVPRG